MNLSASLQSMVHRQIRRFGDGLQITLRERSTLRNRGTGTPTNALLLVGSALAGATAIVADATGLTGSLPAGAKITIGATQYTLAAAAQAVVTTGQLAMTLTTGLAGNLSDDTAVTVSQPYADTTYTAMRSRVDQRDMQDGVPDTARSYRLSAHGQTRKPKKADVLVDTAGTATETVAEVRESPPGSTDIYWTVLVGSAN